MNKNNRRQETVAPIDLLKALNTLQNNSLIYEEELSFGQHTGYNNQESKAMNFEIYMQKKTEPYNIHKQGNFIKTGRKSVTPLKDTTKMINNHSQRHADRKSCSPVPNLKATSTIFRPKNTEKQNQLKNTSQKQQQMSSSKLSYQTRKILTQKQKKGKSYVPIQHRAEELLKEREVKLAKMKKQKELEQMLKEKEYTFQPKIHKSHVSYKPSQVSKARKSAMNNSKVESLKQQISQNDKTIKMEKMTKQCLQKKQTIQPQASSLSLEQTINDNQEELPDHPAPSQQPCMHKKYKNDKFNILLDYLH